MKSLIRKEILLENEKVEYFLKKSIRAHHVRLSVALGGIITMTIPWYFGESRAEIFLRHKSGWILKKIKYFRKMGRLTKLGGSRKDYLKNKELARRLVLQKILEVNKDSDFVFHRVSIRNSKTRWGSCSKKGNLNFNYRVVFLSEKLLEYLVVHELCHLKEFNHSRQFWNLVGRYVSDYKTVKKELKKNIF